MSIPNEIQTLENVITETNIAQVTIAYSTRSIRAQEDLSNKFKAEIERKKEVSNFMKSGNLKLQAEILNAEHELRNSITTFGTITSANTETERVLLLTKENNVKINECMSNAEKNYEKLWIESKNKYESVPIVKKFMQTTKKLEAHQLDLKALENEMNALKTEFEIKNTEIINKERKEIIQLAKFIVHEIPVALNTIKEKSMETEDLMKEIYFIIKEQETDHKKILSKTMFGLNLHLPQDNNEVDDCAKIKKNDDDSYIMPRLQLQPQLDISVKLNINKIGRKVAHVKRTMATTEMDRNTIKRGKYDDLSNSYVSYYLNETTKNVGLKQNNKPEDFSKRKLINILEDVKLDEQETYKIISKVDIDKCQDVGIITADNTRNNLSKQAKAVTPLESEEIEEIDLTNTNDENVLEPPTQFLDLTQGKDSGGYQQVEVIAHGSEAKASSKNGNVSQTKEGIIKKRVSFDIPMSIEEIKDEIENEIVADNKGDETNDTIDIQFNLCLGGHDNYPSNKDMILKKDNLELSPQFVYGKNIMMLEKKTDAKIVTSKFFESNTQYVETDEVVTANMDVEVKTLGPKETYPNEKSEVQLYKCKSEEENLETMEVDKAVLSPKVNEIEKQVAGLLFAHGPQGIPDCLDMSMNTTGYDGDSDFATGLDSSILLSPKADVSANNIEVESQEGASFLSGLKKAGRSLFRINAPSENPDSSKKNEENNFSFNFCGEEKKNKGGILSFFQ